MPPDLQTVAERLMIERGFDLNAPAGIPAQLSALVEHPPVATTAGADIRDLRSLPWSSIDNDTTRDLDQLEVAQPAEGGAITVMIAIADVDAFVPKGSPIDQFAARQTTTVYTGVRIFPMLPEALSTGLTSLLEDSDRLAVVVELVVDAEGRVASSAISRAFVRSVAQLTYRGVGAWLEGRAPAPAGIRSSKTLVDQLQLQDTASDRLRRARQRRGALNIQRVETRAVAGDDGAVTLQAEVPNRATLLIEDFMIASNEAVAKLLEARHRASIRRVVKEPRRWDRIVALAAANGGTLPAAPDSKALNDFLVMQSTRDPVHFPDLSLAIIKLMGAGEYVLERPDDPETWHFGLAVEDYTHATAPNRRFADLVTQRLLKAALADRPSPYTDDELRAIATACTAKANDARKVEREVGKHMAAVAMQRRIGEVFDAVVTGVNVHGTFVRVVAPHVEGLLEHPAPGTDVGDKLRVRLMRTDLERGYVDFAPASVARG